MTRSAARWVLATSLLLLTLAGLSLVNGRAPSSGELADPNTEVASQPYSELVVDLVDGSTLEAFQARYPELAGQTLAWNSEHSAEEALTRVSVKGLDAKARAALLARLEADPGVEFAEPNLRWSIPEGPKAFAENLLPDEGDRDPRASFPNDPLFEKQWNMGLVNASTAWGYARGRGVIVAVIDTGVAYEDSKGLWAPDLQRTRFVPGYDFVNDDNVAADDHGHGTHCAGTIAQSTNNGRGVIGLAPACKIMPIKVLSRFGWGTTSDIADAIRFAADHGADVISMSLGGGGYSRVLKSAVDYALQRGVTVIAACGNAGRARVEYPAAYPGVLAVSAVGPEGRLAPYSSHGKQCFLAAPGGDTSQGTEGGILQNTIVPGQASGTLKPVYAYWQGTSMATPHVAGAAALLRSCGVTRPEAVASILAKSARAPSEPGGSAWTQEYGWGLLDAGAAVRAAAALPSAFAFGLACCGLLVLAKRSGPRTPGAQPELPRGSLLVGGLMGSSGLFFLRPFLGWEGSPVLDLLCWSVPDWGLVFFGPSGHWNALLASALLPCVLACVAGYGRGVRALILGLCVGWSARLVAGVAFPYADVVGIPGRGLLDGAWLIANALLLLGAIPLILSWGRRRDAGRGLAEGAEA